VIQVDPGTHDLEISAIYGNLHHPTFPIIRAPIEAGKVYQIDFQLGGPQWGDRGKLFLALLWKMGGVREFSFQTPGV
jgi:hypothetical protein